MYFWGEFGSYMMEFGRSGGTKWEVREGEKSKLFETFEKSRNVPNTHQKAPLA